MDIKYLTILQNNPKHWPDRFPNEPTEMEEIVALEKRYNQGEPFPVVLRELLSLAGNYCWIFNMGLYESQTEFQAGLRSTLKRYKHHMPRPFYALDTMDEWFSFIYLDEAVELFDPILYNAYLFGDPNSDLPKIESTEMTLTEMVKHRIETKRALYPQ